MKKRLLAFGLVVIMGISLLAGCGNSNNGSSSAGNKETGAETAAESGEASTGGEVELTFPCIWVGTDSKAEVFGKMVEGFNTEYAGQYKIKIEEQTDYDLYRDKLRTQISTGTTPDIFTVDSYADLELFAQSGYLMDLTDFLADSEMSNLFAEGMIEGAKVDGVNYGFPYENAVIPIMYNKNLLEQVGVENVPTSYDELWDVCEKLQATGIFPTTQMTANNAWTSMLWYSYAVAAAGGADVYTRGLDDPAFVKAAEIMQKMFEYTSSDAVGADATVVNGHFFNERAAIYTNGTWILGRIKTEAVEGLYDNLAITPGLSLDGQNGGAYVTQVQAYFAAAKQDDPAKEEAVKAFFKYICDPDRVLELANSSGALFAINIDASKITDPVQAEIAQQCSDAAFLIGHFQGMNSTAVVTEFPAALESLVLGDITPEEFVEQLKAADE